MNCTKCGGSLKPVQTFTEVTGNKAQATGDSMCKCGNIVETKNTEPRTFMG